MSSTGPPPGWYPDPEVPNMLRYWDGSMWTAHRTPEAQLLANPNALPDLGAWFSESWRVVTERWREGLLLSIIQIPAVAAVWFTFYWAFADFVVENDEISGFSGARTAVLVIVLLGVFVVQVLSYFAVVRQMQMGHLGIPETPGDSLRRAVGRLPRTILLAVGALLATVALLVILTVLAIIWVPLAVIAGIAVVVAAIWSIVSLAFIGIALIVAPKNAKVISASISVGRGRWWAMFGRILLVILLAAVVQTALGAATGAIFDGPEPVLETNEDGEIVRFEFSDVDPGAARTLASVFVSGVLGALVSLPSLSAMTKLYLAGGGPSDPPYAGGSPRAS